MDRYESGIRNKQNKMLRVLNKPQRMAMKMVKNDKYMLQKKRPLFLKETYKSIWKLENCRVKSNA